MDWRNEFSKWFCNEFKQIKFPSTGNVFGFFIDPETKKFLPWSEKVESFELDPDIPLQVCFCLHSAIFISFSMLIYSTSNITYSHAWCQRPKLRVYDFLWIC